SEVPHPKLDAVTKMLGEKIARREKALVFVRRVATTKDLATRASEYFDQQIIEAIECVSDPKEHQLLDEIYRVWRKKRVSRIYIEDMNDVKAADAQDNVMTSEHDTSDEDEDDSVSEVVPSLFTWFFRGEHSALSKDFPDIDIFSGRRMREQLEARSRFSLILEENYVDWVLKRPKNVVARLAQDSGLNEEQVLEQISSKFADELS